MVAKYSDEIAKNSLGQAMRRRGSVGGYEIDRVDR